MTSSRQAGGSPRRGTRRRWRLIAPLAMAWPMSATGAAFLPGAADEPTGAVTRPPATAEEPLQGDGIQCVLAPWRVSGSLALDARSLRDATGRREHSLAQLGDIDAASHIWQPWFVQVRLGMGWVAARNRSSLPADAPGAGSDGLSLTGRAALSVFPASRFPFELRVDRSDSRSTGLAIGGDYRSQRLSLTQSWRPAVGGQSLQLAVDRSTLQRAGLTDTLATFSASALVPVDGHQWDFGLSHSDHHRSDTDERTTLSSAHVRHARQPGTDIQAETMANWTESRLATAGRRSGGEVAQLSHFLSWRLASGPLLTGSARWLQSRGLGEAARPAVQAVNATVGATLEPVPDWRLGLSGSANHFDDQLGGQARSAGLQANASWVPAARLFGTWRWTPGASAQLGATQDSRLGRRELAGVQLNHGFTREQAWGPQSLLSLGVTQGAAVLGESGAPELLRSLQHGASVGWRRQADDGGQGLASLSWNASRTLGQRAGRFELVNLQLSQRLPLTRYASWSASLTAQASRNRASDVDAFTGERRALSQGWLPFYSGSASYEHLRAFGVPRLRLALLLGVQSQPLARRAAGDIDAEADRISHSLEARLDWSVGRLETRVSARAARVEGRDVVAIQARAQRRF